MYLEKTYHSFETGFNPVFLQTMVVGGFGPLPLPEAWWQPNQVRRRHGHTMMATPPALGLINIHRGHEQSILLQHCNFCYTSKHEQI
jgi:hypothetical protein